MSKPTRDRRKRQMTRAELKAYEARRADEARRRELMDDDALPTTPARSSRAARAVPATSARRTRTLSMEQEFAIIKSDIRRLVIVLAILLVILIIATFVLR